VNGATSLGRLLNWSLFDTCHLAARTVFVRQTHAPNLSLTPSVYAADAFLKDPSMPCNMSNEDAPVQGFENVTVFLQNTFQAHEHTLILEYYAGVELPVQGPSTSKRLWGSRIGNDGHLGFMTGFDMSLRFWRRVDHAMRFFVRGEGHYWTEARRERTCDIYSKPLSRYMTGIDLKDGTTSVMAGTLTVPVHVHPSGFIDLSAGLTYVHPRFTATLGGNVWGHAREYVYADTTTLNSRLRYENLSQHGIGEAGQAGTFSTSTIAKLGPQDTVPVALRLNDLHFDTGGFPGGYSLSVFGSCELKIDHVDIDAGGWIEHGQPGRVLSRYGGWIGVGVTW